MSAISRSMLTPVAPDRISDDRTLSVSRELQALPRDLAGLLDPASGAGREIEQRCRQRQTSLDGEVARGRKPGNEFLQPRRIAGRPGGICPVVRIGGGGSTAVTKVSKVSAARWIDARVDRDTRGQPLQQRAGRRDSAARPGEKARQVRSATT